MADFVAPASIRPPGYPFREGTSFEDMLDDLDHRVEGEAPVLRDAGGCGLDAELDPVPRGPRPELRVRGGGARHEVRPPHQGYRGMGRLHQDGQLVAGLFVVEVEVRPSFLAELHQPSPELVDVLQRFPPRRRGGAVVPLKRPLRHSLDPTAGRRPSYKSETAESPFPSHFESPSAGWRAPGKRPGRDSNPSTRLDRP